MLPSLNKVFITGIIIIIINIIIMIVFIILKEVPLWKVTSLDLNSMTLLKEKHEKLSICLSSLGSSSDVINIERVTCHFHRFTSMSYRFFIALNIRVKRHA